MVRCDLGREDLMQRDRKRESGFYWVRFEGEVVVAEYTADGAGWSAGDGQWWRVPGSSHSFEDDQVCELLSERIPSPGDLKELLIVARGSHLLTVPRTVTMEQALRLAEVERDSLKRTKGVLMERANVYAAIDSERAFQDRKWGTVDKHPHEVGAWITLMHKVLLDAEIAWASRSGDYAALEEIRKVIAVGVACCEQHGVKTRSKFTEPPVESMRHNDRLLDSR